MKTTIFAAILTLCLASALPAFADDTGKSVKFSVSLYSKYLDGMGKVTIFANADGSLQITHDTNRCDADGRSCTKMMPRHFDNVRPEVIEDGRRSDGPLLLKLTSNLKLEVSAGMGSDPTYTVIYDSSNGVVQANLISRVYLGLLE